MKTCKLKGDISENRAKEILKENFAPSSRIEKGYLYFNNYQLKIIPNEKINQAVLALIKKEKLADAKASDVKFLSPEKIKELVLQLMLRKVIQS